MKTQLIVTALFATSLGTVAAAQEKDANPEEELAVLPAFDTVDANEDGMVDAAESETLMKVLEEEHQITFQFEAADSNQDGLINSREYIAYDAVLKDRLGIS